MADTSVNPRRISLGSLTIRGTTGGLWQLREALQAQGLIEEVSSPGSSYFLQGETDLWLVERIQVPGLNPATGKRCVHCGQETPLELTLCPACGAPLPGTTLWR